MAAPFIPVVRQFGPKCCWLGSKELCWGRPPATFPALFHPVIFSAMEPLHRDPDLWRQAKARARFKASLFTYFWVNALLWTIWALTGRGSYPVPWPLWATFFWGIGLLANAASVYGWWGQSHQAEREYERLLREKR